jgi:abortive infection bacteriophage resistance protein
VTSTYGKPFLSVDDQIDLLEERGLLFNDRNRAQRELQAIGYYRLSGYWYPFRRPAFLKGAVRPSEFVEGATLDEVLAIYRFDERLRVELMYALSQIEVAMRFRIGRRGPFAHNDPKALDSGWSRVKPRVSHLPSCTSQCSWLESDHDEWMRKQERNENVSNEAFIAHFNSHYGKPLPIWTATEVISFGDLNRLFGGLNQRDREQIAVDLDVYQPDGNGDAGALSNWLEHLRQTRNYCAHHARLWNRNHTAPLSIPDAVSEMAHLDDAGHDGNGAQPVSRAASRVYGSLVLIAYLLARINYANDVRDRIRNLIEEFTAGAPDRLQSMGFPLGWERETIWQANYGRDKKLSQRATALRDIDLLYTADAAALLTHKPNYKERPGRLGYYRKNGAALSVPGTEAYRYPAFQFDPSTGDLFPLAIDANRRLLNGSIGTDEMRWQALMWWTTSIPQLPGGMSPLKTLEGGLLTSEMIREHLDPVGVSVTVEK